MATTCSHYAVCQRAQKSYPGQANQPYLGLSIVKLRIEHCFYFHSQQTISLLYNTNNIHLVKLHKEGAHTSR